MRVMEREMSDEGHALQGERISTSRVSSSDVE
jgi:hypothetical protein